MLKNLLQKLPGVNSDHVLVVGGSYLIKVIFLVFQVLFVEFFGENNFAQLTTTISVIFVLQASSGLGIQWSWLKYDQELLKDNWSFPGLMLLGLLLSLPVSIVLRLVVLEFLGIDLEYLLILLSLVFIFEFFKIESRRTHNNKDFILSELIYTSVLMLAAVVLVIFDSKRFELAIIVALLVPIFYLFMQNKKLGQFFSLKMYRFQSIRKNVIVYAVSNSVGLVLNALYLNAIILVSSRYLDDADAGITAYKIFILVPMQLVVVFSLVFFTDFKLIEKLDVNSIKKYLKDKRWIQISLVGLFFLYLVIYEFAISEKYAKIDFGAKLTFLIYMIVSIMYRVPLSNILNISGYSHLNVLNVFLSLLCFYIPLYFSHIPHTISALFVLFNLVGIFNGLLARVFYRWKIG